MSVKRELSPNDEMPTSSSPSPSDETIKGVKELKLEDLEAPKPKKRKTKRSSTKKSQGDSETKETSNTKSSKGSWSEEQDKVLHALITNNLGGNEVKASWKDVHLKFTDKFPEVEKTINSLQCRWKQAIRAGNTELTGEEKYLFKQAVADIDGNERPSAYAWRFKELGGKDLNKTAASKLHKMLKAGQLD